MTTFDSVPAPAAADYRAQGRTAAVFTTAVNYRLSGYVCVAAYRLRMPPTLLTLGNLVFGVGTSTWLIVLAGPITASPGLSLGAGAAAWLLWQIAYIFDCADGQLARVTGASSAAGGRLDVLVDIAVQISLVAAVTTLAAAAAAVPAWLAAAFGGTWMVNLVTSVMAREGTNRSLISSDGAAIRIIKVVRDYGAMLTVVAGVLAVRPELLLWVMVMFTAVNGSFLLASIAQSGRASLHLDAPPNGPQTGPTSLA